MDPSLPYLLLTPGPLSTTRAVKEAMLTDLSTWDVDYNALVERVRTRLVELAVADPAARARYSAVLMQGSGTFAVEATLGSTIPDDGGVLVIENGAYGERMGLICDRLGIPRVTLAAGEEGAVDPLEVERLLARHPALTHVALVHCETTTGRMNPAAEVAAVCRARGVSLLLDAMSSFGGVPFDQHRARIPFVISSANKCIQGVPGFGFVVAERAALEACAGRARSLSLDLFDQWRGMEQAGGKWRFTSPTHVVLAFDRALQELDEEGGVAVRHARLVENHERTVAGLAALGIEPLLPPAARGPIITAFRAPRDPAYDFDALYAAMKRRGFVTYPGKLTAAETFRIGHIGDVHPADVERMLGAMAASLAELGVASPA